MSNFYLTPFNTYEEKPEFKTNAVYGDALLKIALTAEKFDKRDCYSKVHYFLYTSEIKKIKVHSKEIVDFQYRHIIDSEKIEATEKQFGKVVRQCVLYRGESTTLANKIEYKNVEEYLTELR